MWKPPKDQLERNLNNGGNVKVKCNFMRTFKEYYVPPDQEEPILPVVLKIHALVFCAMESCRQTL